jgi:hypothetical protein
VPSNNAGNDANNGAKNGGRSSVCWAWPKKFKKEKEPRANYAPEQAHALCEKLRY